MKDNYERYLITAGGRIKCHRCQAKSLGSKQQCAKPSLRNKNVCGHHGGLSTGPKTAEGIKRIQAAHWKHGKETKQAKADRSQKSLMFLMLEMIGWHVHLFHTNSTRIKGRKPNNYKKIDFKNLNDLNQAIRLINTLSNSTE